jgi:hypothetical protein
MFEPVSSSASASSFDDTLLRLPEFSTDEFRMYHFKVRRKMRVNWKMEEEWGRERERQREKEHEREREKEDEPTSSATSPSVVV